MENIKEEVQQPLNPQPATAPTELNPQQALSVLIQGVQFAQSKGVYSLEDAGLLDKAVKVFVTKPENKEAAPAVADETKGGS